jgi:hypothetical protein
LQRLDCRENPLTEATIQRLRKEDEVRRSQGKAFTLDIE